MSGEQIYHRQDVEEGDATDEKISTCKVEIPVDVVVKIVQKVPFPHSFKGRLLNREWCSSFQERMSPVTHNWPIYCPALLSPGGELIGFDKSVDGGWHRMKFESLQRLDRRNTFGVFGRPPAGILEGVLLCTLGTSRDGVNATVLNLLSGKRRIISSPLRGRCIPVFSCVGLEKYEILLLGQESDGNREFEPRLQTYRYDSHSLSWVQKSLAHGRLAHLIRYLPQSGRISYTHLDGNLYWYYRRIKSRTFQVYRTNLEDGSESESLPITLGIENLNELLTFELLKCGPRIIMVASWPSGDSPELPNGASICEVEKENFNLIELSRSPPSIWPGVDTTSLSDLETKSVADNERVYLCRERVVSYHLESGTWNSHESLPAGVHGHCDHRMLHKKLCKILCVKFEPGLNPFAVP